MRLHHSARNLAVSWGGQALFLVTNLVALGIFGRQMPEGANTVMAVFTSLLATLSLAELGIGSAIIYALYEPLAKHDTEKIRSLMRLFRRAYICIGIGIFLVGCVLLPFLQELFDGDVGISLFDLRLYFICYLVNSSISYFFSYKGALIQADQQKYILALYQYGFQVLMNIAQIIVLLLTQSFLLFLVCQVASTFLQNLFIYLRANRMYPYLLGRSEIQPIDPPTLATIKKNVAALVMHKLAYVISTPASTLIISMGIPLSVNPTAAASYGYYYTTIALSLTRVMDQIFDAIVASVGNLAVTESSARQLEVFKTAFFVNAFAYTVTAVPLLCVFNLFVSELWVGPNYVLPVPVTALVVALYFLKGMRSAGLSFTNAYGLYWFTRWKAVLETAVLLVLSLTLVHFFEIAGVLAAGIITTVCVSAIYEGVMLFRHGLKTSSRGYFVSFALYTLLACGLAVAACGLTALIPLSGIAGFLVKGICGLLIAAGGFIVPFCRSREFAECVAMAHRLMTSVRARRQ
ncbi:MAG: hypothetical protein LBO07_07025 [Coriobacteriales bacterium]|jgi:hypothetical protein|nr:hypothetical protein [Coriobacteriales bacterium]